MENKMLRIGILKFTLKKLKIIAIFLFCFSFSPINSQTMEYLGNGMYDFDTNFPNSDLHFYLFDDGYHSFDKNIIHTFINTSLPAVPTLYHAEPYDQDNPDDISFLDVDEGVLYAGPTILDFSNQIEVKRSWNMVEKRENFFLLMFENIDDVETVSGCVEFHFDKNEIQIAEDKILDDYGNGWVEYRTIENSDYSDYTHKYKWEFYNMKPGEQRFIYITAECLRDVFSIINTKGVLKIDNCNEVIPDNSKLDGSNEEIYDSKFFTLESIVSNFPHDPNYMSTDPECLEPDWGAQNIKYNVYFQNDGKDPVQNVYIDLQTSGDINYDNVKLSNSSHYCELSWEEDAVFITFPDIFLQGMGQDPEPNTYEETVGWVELEICFNLISTIGDPIECINSAGGITFDIQAPIPISNSLCTSELCQDNIEEIGKDCPVSESYQDYNGTGLKTVTANEELKGIDFQILPNISKDQITISGCNNYSNLNCSIISSYGGFVKVINLDTSRQINISNLPKGVYYISVFNNSSSQTKKFVKF